MTIGANGFDLEFKLYFLFPFSSISAVPSALAVTLAVFLPIGALIYFFLRKRLTITEQPKTESMLEISEQTTEENIF